MKPGQEDSFVAAWQEMAARTEAEFPEASALLLRDRDVPGPAAAEAAARRRRLTLRASPA